MSETSSLLVVRRLKVQFPLPGARPWRRSGQFEAVGGIDFNLAPGETLGIVGESGCGKSTLARALVGLQRVSAGAIEYQGVNLARLDAKGWRPYRRDIQLVFQDPLASLNPRMTIGRLVEEPLSALFPEMGEAERKTRVANMLEQVGLSAALLNRYAHEFSGGQCQRVGLARALVVEPRILVCDEPVSALDVSVQAQIVNLLQDIQTRTGLAMIFIAHDLAVVRHLSQRVLVMYLGRIMEQGTREQVFASPAHPYTRALLASVAAGDVGQTDEPVAVADGSTDMRSLPSGCVFVGRCQMADERCARLQPHLIRVAHGGHAACHYIGNSVA